MDNFNLSMAKVYKLVSEGMSFKDAYNFVFTKSDNKEVKGSERPSSDI